MLIGPGDWDGDGKADVITGDSAGWLWLWRGDGNGGLSATRTRIGTEWNSFTVVIAGGDFSGDRKRRPDGAHVGRGGAACIRGTGKGGFGTRKAKHRR